MTQQKSRSAAFLHEKALQDHDSLSQNKTGTVLPWSKGMDATLCDLYCASERQVGVLAEHTPIGADGTFASAHTHIGISVLNGTERISDDTAGSCRTGRADDIRAVASPEIETFPAAMVGVIISHQKGVVTRWSLSLYSAVSSA